MRKLQLLFTTPVAITAILSGAVAAAPQADGEGSANMTHVAQFEFDDLHDRGANAGTDIEFVTLGEQTYSLSGSYYNGLVIHDVSDPENVAYAGTYDCGIAQGDVQTFTREERMYVVFTRDNGYALMSESACAVWAERNATDAFSQAQGYGSWIADITDPANPETVAFVPFKRGSHNITVHPSGDYLYNSNSDLITTVASGPGIEVTDIRDLANPTPVTTLALPIRPGLGTESHDITFSVDGTRAYSAALSQTLIIDTTDPTNPSVISSLLDPAINVEHQATPVSINDPILGERDFLIVEDEFAGAIGTGQCPNGGVHIYDITGPLELQPVKVGFWNLPATETGLTADSLASCTAHVFQIHEAEQLMTIAYYNGGVRVVDLSQLVGVALGNVGAGMSEVAWFRFDDMDAWSVKAPYVDRDGVFYVYSGDMNRGMDVFKVDMSGAAEFAVDAGVWLTPDQALGQWMRNPADLSTYTPRCLLGDDAIA
ncbi:MAG: hypothetical protein ACI867_001807 [Glaciecola sp.]|jgi:hypothetical protein